MLSFNTSCNDFFVFCNTQQRSERIITLTTMQKRKIMKREQIIDEESHQMHTQNTVTSLVRPRKANDFFFFFIFQEIEKKVDLVSAQLPKGSNQERKNNRTIIKISLRGLGRCRVKVFGGTENVLPHNNVFTFVC